MNLNDKIAAGLVVVGLSGAILAGCGGSGEGVNSSTYTGISVGGAAGVLESADGNNANNSATVTSNSATEGKVTGTGVVAMTQWGVASKDKTGATTAGNVGLDPTQRVDNPGLGANANTDPGN